jgi:hypothetical protein
MLYCPTVSYFVGTLHIWALNYKFSCLVHTATCRTKTSVLDSTYVAQLVHILLLAAAEDILILCSVVTGHLKISSWDPTQTVARSGRPW